VERIQALVADYYNITLDDMNEQARDKHIVFPRQVAMFLVREETPRRCLRSARLSAAATIRPRPFD